MLDKNQSFMDSNQNSVLLDKNLSEGPEELTNIISLKRRPRNIFLGGALIIGRFNVSISTSDFGQGERY